MDLQAEGGEDAGVGFDELVEELLSLLRVQRLWGTWCVGSQGWVEAGLRTQHLLERSQRKIGHQMAQSWVRALMATADIDTTPCFDGVSSSRGRPQAEHCTFTT